MRRFDIGDKIRCYESGVRGICVKFYTPTACEEQTINCPYYAGDKRAYCRKEGSLVTSREVCVDCKAHWLEQEVDE